MATTVSDLVASVQDDLRSDLSGYLTDTQIAGLIGSAIALLNGRLPAYCSYTIADKAGGQVATTSTISPEISPESVWGALLRSAVRLLLATSGALVMGEKNVGSYSTPSHSVSQASRASQHRLNRQMCLDDFNAIVSSIKYLDQHDQADVDFTVAEW